LAELYPLVRPEGDQAARLEQLEIAQRVRIADGRCGTQAGRELSRAKPGCGILEKREQQLRGVHRRQRGLDEAAEVIGKGGIFHYSGS
jgi:hypothetical protein